MPSFALFDFFEENAIDVGEWKWVLDNESIDPQLSQSAEVIVQWPTNPKVLKSLGRKPIPVNESETKDCAAYVLKTGDDLKVLREMANKVLNGSDTSFEPEKRHRKRNMKYLEETDDDENKPLASKKRKKIIPAKIQELQLSETIEADLNAQLNSAKAIGGKDVVLNDDDTDSDDEGKVTLQKRYFLLQEENRALKAKNKKLCQILHNQKGISDVLDAVKDLGKKLDDSLVERTSLPSLCVESVQHTPCRRTSLGNKAIQFESPKPTLTKSSTPMASTPVWSTPTMSKQPRLPLSSIENQLPECKMITLWEGTEVTEAQKKILNSKKGNVRDYINTLLRMLFKADELAESSLTGKTSNAFKNFKVAKPKLRNVDNIIDYATIETHGAESKIKAAITQLLNTESKR